MRIIELTLENFSGIYATMYTYYVHLDLRNQKHKICLITGPNGHGKTVLLSQLNPFATLGTVDERDALPLIIEGKEGHKQIIIENKNDEYIIDHFYTPNKKTHSIKSYIKKNSEELNPNGNVTSFKETVKAELDMEPEYMKLVRLGNNVTNLIELRSAERKTFMSKILDDANIYLVYYKKINSELNTLRTLISHATDKLKKTHIEDYDSAKESLKSKEKELKILEKRVLDLSNQLGQINLQLSQLSQNAMSDMSECGKKLKKLNEKLENTTLDELRETEKELVKLVSSLEEREKQSKENMTLFLDQIDSFEVAEADLMSDLEKYRESELEDIKEEIDKITDDIGCYEEQFKDYKDINYTSEDIKELLAFLKEKQEALNTTYEFGQEPIKKVIELMEKQEDVGNYIRKKLKELTEDEEIENGRNLIRRIISKNSLKAPSNCPGKCDVLETIRYFYEISSSVIDHDKPKKEFYTYMELAYNNIKSVLLSFGDKKELFQKVPKYICDQYITKVLMEKIKATQMIYDQKVFFDELAFITEYEIYLSLKDRLKELKKEKKKILSNNGILILQEQLNKTREQLESFRGSFKDSKEKMQYAHSKLIEKKANLDSIRSFIELGEKKKEIEERYERACHDVSMRKELSQDLLVSSHELQNCQEQIRFLQSKISELQMGLKQAKEYNKELRVYNKFYDNWVLLKESLSSNTGIPLVFIDLYLEKAKTTVNSLLDEIYNGDIYVEKFDVQSDSFNIPFVKNGNVISDIRYASQGERSFFSIALSFAISFESMSKYNIMLLDELDSVLDESNRSKFISILEKLIDMIDAEQIFVISHNNMFSMYPVDVISVINSDNEDRKMANYIKLEFSN